MPEFIRPARAIIVEDGSGGTVVLLAVVAAVVFGAAAAVVAWVLAHALIVAGLAAAVVVATVELLGWLYRHHTVIVWHTTTARPPAQRARARQPRALPAPPKAIEASAVIRPNGDLLIPRQREISPTRRR